MSDTESDTESGKEQAREQLRSERRAQILDAALLVFSRNGYHESTVSDVAAQAGVAQGTIYTYFASKEELLQELVVLMFDRIAAPFTEVLRRTDKPPVGRIREAFRMSSLMLSESGEQLRLLIGLWGQPDLFRPGEGESSVVLGEYEASLLEPLTGVIQEAMDAGDAPDGDARAVAVAIGALMEGLMLYASVWPEGVVELERLESVVIGRLLEMRP